MPPSPQKLEVRAWSREGFQTLSLLTQWVSGYSPFLRYQDGTSQAHQASAFRLQSIPRTLSKALFGQFKQNLGTVWEKFILIQSTSNSDYFLIPLFKKGSKHPSLSLCLRKANPLGSSWTDQSPTKSHQSTREDAGQSTSKSQHCLEKVIIHKSQILQSAQKIQASPAQMLKAVWSNFFQIYSRFLFYIPIIISHPSGSEECGYFPLLREVFLVLKLCPCLDIQNQALYSTAWL